MAMLDLNDDDVDLLARISQAEAGRIRHPQAMAAVAENVLNRVAHGGFGGRDIRSVLSAPRQYEPVTRYGGVDRLPPASQAARQAVMDYIEHRAGGGEQIVPGQTNFANWTVGYTAPAYRSWGRNQQGTMTFGSGGLQHTHGRAPGVTVPDYQVRMNGRGGDGFGAWLASQDEETRGRWSGYQTQSPAAGGARSGDPQRPERGTQADAFDAWLKSQDDATRQRWTSGQPAAPAPDAPQAAEKPAGEGAQAAPPAPRPDPAPTPSATPAPAPQAAAPVPEPQMVAEAPLDLPIPDELA